jgi:putative peptidoglycan lipid II flippase
MSRLAARHDDRGFANTVGLGLRQIAFTLIPASVISAVLAEPIVRLVYQRGEFTPHQTTVVAGALAAFSIGLVFNGAMLMLMRTFFSLQSNWIPTTIALANLGVNAALDAVFYRLGIWGIPLATSVVNMAGTIALIAVLQRRKQRLDLGEIGKATALICVVSALLAGVAFGVWDGLDHALGQSFGAQLLSLGGALAVGIAFYVLACKLLGVRELHTLLSLRRRARPS